MKSKREVGLLKLIPYMTEEEMVEVRYLVEKNKEMDKEVALRNAKEGYREYLKNMLEDRDFDVENLEDFDTWLEEEFYSYEDEQQEGCWLDKETIRTLIEE
jgi:hypothetical protein